MLARALFCVASSALLFFLWPVVLVVSVLDCLSDTPEIPDCPLR